MPPAIPTPFDITDIPYIPWSPDGTTWLVVLSLLLLIYLGLPILKHLRSSRRFEASALLLKELKEIRPRANQLERHRLIRLSQRALAFVSSKDVRGLSSAELTLLAESPGHADIRKLLNLLAALENDQYAPPEMQNSSATLEHAELLYEALKGLLVTRRDV